MFIFSVHFQTHLMIIDDTAKGGLTIFWKIFTVLPCASKQRYLKTFVSQIETRGFLKVEEDML